MIAVVILTLTDSLTEYKWIHFTRIFWLLFVIYILHTYSDIFAAEP